MIFAVNADERSVPWYNRNEFFEVFSWLVDSELDSKYLALNRLKVWEERAHGITKQCPIAVIGTSCILHAMLQDGIWDWGFISRSASSGCLNDDFKTLMGKIARGEINYYQNNMGYRGGDESLDMYYSIVPLSIQNQYCMAVTRIINLFVDQCQHQFYARSISVISEELGIPQILVEIRHQATHGSELPSLETCRVGGILIFLYLISKYWKGQYDCLIESASVLDKRLHGYFDELIPLLSNLYFDWDVHNFAQQNSSHIENTTLLDLYNEHSETYHGCLLKVVFEHISIKVPMRNRILKHFQETSKSKVKNERKVANRMIKMLTDFGEFSSNSNVKLGKLKKWVKKCYTLLPVFYRQTERIIVTMNNNEVEEAIVKDFIINWLLENVCPLCCPISEILALHILKLLSNNAKVEILSKILTALFGNNTYASANDLKPSRVKTDKGCNQSQKEVRYFYWLVILLPDVGSISSDGLLEDNKPSVKGNKRVIEPILLLTFYKRFDKINYAKRLMDYEKIIETLNLSKYSMLVIFSELVSSIPDIIFKSKTKLNQLALSVMHLLSDLKIFDSTSKLLCALLNKNQKLSVENIELIKQFLWIRGGNDPTGNMDFFTTSYKSSRGVIVEDSGITPFLKTGTGWDRDRLEIIDHVCAYQNGISLHGESGQINSNLENISSDDEAVSANYVDVNEDIFYCDEIQPAKTITLGMEHNSCIGEQNNPMNTCLLNAEMFMRKNVGTKERMNEMAISIDWSKVKHFSELQ